MKVGYVQFKPIFGKNDENLSSALELLKEGVGMGGELMVLPELFNSGYVFKNRRELEDSAEEIPNGKNG